MGHKMKYFSYHVEHGFLLHETEEEARDTAKDYLDAEREEAYAGWSDEVSSICWGELKQYIAETLRRPVTEEDSFLDSGIDEVVDYGLVNIEGINNPFGGLPAWVDYIATDGDGSRYGYRHKPIFYNGSNDWAVNTELITHDIVDEAIYLGGSMKAADSLICRHKEQDDFPHTTYFERDGKPCGECNLMVGERCDICGIRHT